MAVTRRDALNGLLATPLIAAGSAVGASAPLSTKKDKYRLNLVMHGMVVVVVPDKLNATASDGIEILIPGYPEHKHLWGLWCQEIVMNGGGGSFEITGLTRNQPLDVEDLDPDSNAVMEQPFLRRTGSADIPLFCSIKVPFPEKKWSLRKVCQHPYIADFLINDAAYYLRRAPIKIAMVHVFQYSFSDANDVLFGGNKIALEQGQTTVNLHIWSDPVEGRHVTHDDNLVLDAKNKAWMRKATPFELMVKAFTDIDCEQSVAYRDRSGALDDAEPLPQGMMTYEKYTLQERGYPVCKQSFPTVTQKCDYSEPAPPRAKIVHCMSLFVYGSQ